ncbi:MAG: hypothetical protein VB031_02360 [Eubacteriaceae bacterium]|nr:hypothetical protein [Eubacteriaceae bacterium]
MTLTDKLQGRINMSGPPTKRQQDYAERIAEKLDLALPAEKTKAAYSDFISEWSSEYSDYRYEKE